MLKWLEITSFHVAVSVLAAILFTPIFARSNFSYSLWFASCSLSLIGFSAITRAYSSSLWRSARPHIAAMIIVVGHLAPASAVYLYHLMHAAGQGSGVVFIPIAAWAIVFYGLGIAMTLNRFSNAEKYPDA